MATIVTTNFSAIHDALNRLIINELKAALRLVPGKRIEGGSLCRIVVTINADYQPCDLAVEQAWLDDEDHLHFKGTGSDEWAPDYEGDEEDTDWLDITDFHNLIEQLKDQMPDGRHVLINYDDMQAVASAAVGSMLEY